jgi:hypothetical protein
VTFPDYRTLYDSWRKCQFCAGWAMIAAIAALLVHLDDALLAAKVKLAADLSRVYPRECSEMLGGG